ncbi:hypothetical protein Tco_1184290 [Tanacetum coccineum]
MSQDQSIQRRNKVDWHMANDNPILTTMRFIPQHKVVQKYGSILLNYLTTQAMKESKAYNTYHALATGKVHTKPKYVRRSFGTKTDDVPKASSGKRVKDSAKVAKSGKKKQPAIGLETLSDIALTKAEQLKLATKRSLTQTHISQPSGFGTHEGTGKSSDEDDNDDNEDDDDDQGVPDDDQGIPDHDQGVPDDDQGNDNDSERTISDTEGDDFVHPKFTSQDTEERHEEEDKDEESFNSRVQTPSHYEPLDDEANDNLAQSGYAEEEEVNVEQTFEANINLEGRDAKMTDAPKNTQVIEDTHVTLTSVNHEGIDSILNVETTSLIDVPVTSQATTTLPQPSNPLIPPYVTAFSLIPNMVDNYLGSKLKESVDVVVQLKSDRLREEAQTENESFLNNLDATMQKIIKEQVNTQVKKEVSKILQRIKKLVNEQLKSEVLIRSSHEAKSSHAVATNLSELELKKILIDKIESNKSIDRSDEKKNLYKALVDAYAADKDLLDAYGDTGSKRRRAGKEPESYSAPKETASKSTEEPIHTEDDFEEPTHQEFKTGVNDDQPEDEIHPHPDCLVELEYFFEEVYKATTEQLDKTNPDGLQYPHDLRKPLPLISNTRGRQVIPFDHFINNDVAYLSGGVSSRKDDDKLYSFKEGDLKRLWLQDIEDMLILLVPGKLSNLKIEERLDFSNKDKKNRLMRLDELHKFSDGTLDDVQTALDDRLKGIRMEYLPKTIWR